MSVTSDGATVLDGLSYEGLGECSPGGDGSQVLDEISLSGTATMGVVGAGAMVLDGVEFTTPTSGTVSVREVRINAQVSGLNFFAVTQDTVYTKAMAQVAVRINGIT
jgi:hypothetical protein